jgi:glycosyltransferase involved in cell wall biosynthesis
MTTPPKYSVIVPLFNKEPYVLRALASILKLLLWMMARRMEAPCW